MDKIDDIDARVTKDLKQLQMRIAQQRTEMAALITKAEQRAERALERASSANDKAERAVFTANNKQCSHGDAQNPG